MIFGCCLCPSERLICLLTQRFHIKPRSTWIIMMLLFTLMIPCKVATHRQHMRHSYSWKRCRKCRSGHVEKEGWNLEEDDKNGANRCQMRNLCFNNQRCLRGHFYYSFLSEMKTHSVDNGRLMLRCSEMCWCAASLYQSVLISPQACWEGTTALPALSLFFFFCGVLLFVWNVLGPSNRRLTCSGARDFLNPLMIEILGRLVEPPVFFFFFWSQLSAFIISGKASERDVYTSLLCTQSSVHLFSKDSFSQHARGVWPAGAVTRPLCSKVQTSLGWAAGSGTLSSSFNS